MLILCYIYYYINNECIISNINMRLSLFSKILTFLFSIIIITITIYNNVSSPLICEAYLPYTQNNILYKIQETGKEMWDVFFKKVNICYTVTCNDKTYFGNIENHNLHTHTINYINSNTQNNFYLHKGINSPLDQFLIKEFISIVINLGGNVKLLFTNMAFYLSITTFLVFSLNVLYNKLKGLISNIWSLNKESIYGTIHGVVINQINVIKGQNFLPFIYTLFIFIFVSNLIGMVPYSFSPTSHFILTFFVSFTVVLGSTILGFSSYKDKFFSIFVPSGCPTALLPLLVLIEFISYLARNVSLGLRLAANILSGHMLLNILSGFTYNIVVSGFVAFFIGLIPLIFITAFSTLEIGICFIQAQVFSVLSSSYIKDGVLLH